MKGNKIFWLPLLVTAAMLQGHPWMQQVVVTHTSKQMEADANIPMQWNQLAETTCSVMPILKIYWAQPTCHSCYHSNKSVPPHLKNKMSQIYLQ
jgi:hypothetical protein